jgi:hypothetical protein
LEDFGVSFSNLTLEELLGKDEEEGAGELLEEKAKSKRILPPSAAKRLGITAVDASSIPTTTLTPSIPKIHGIEGEGGEDVKRSPRGAETGLTSSNPGGSAPRRPQRGPLIGPRSSSPSLQGEGVTAGGARTRGTWAGADEGSGSEDSAKRGMWKRTSTKTNLGGK